MDEATSVVNGAVNGAVNGCSGFPEPGSGEWSYLKSFPSTI